MERATEGIVVCGGGIIGTSLLYHLTRKGVKPTLIERNTIACGASGKAGGFLAKDWCGKGLVQQQFSRRSYELHAELSVKLGVDCGYRKLDTLGVEVNMKRKSPHVKSALLPEWMDKNSATSKTLGSNETTAQVHPEKLSHAFVDAAKTAGATVVFAQVEGIEWDQSTNVPKVVGVHINVNGKKSVMPAKSVVIAMGPWSKWLLGWLPNNSNVSGYQKMLDISACKAHSILLHPTIPVTPHAVFLSYIDQHGTFSDPEIYPRPDGQVYTCGVAINNYDLPIDPADVKPDDTAKGVLYEMIGTVSSRLAETPVDKLQACCLPISPDNVPLIGRVPGVDGLYIATGHGCWGILNAPATGAALADLIVDGSSSSVDLSPFDPKRFMK